MAALNPPKLVQLRYSPATERARFGLDHQGIEYEAVDHTPFLGERRLRRLAGNPKGRVSVPILLAQGELITGSWDIIRYADAHSDERPLYPPGDEATISEIMALADEALEQSRTLLMSKMLDSPDALMASLPWRLPKPLSFLGLPVARYGSQWFVRKYGCTTSEPERARGRMREVLTSFRQRLNGRTTLLAEFSVADIAICSCLQGVIPLPNSLIELAPPVREAWTDPQLAEEFPDLVEYRDAIYDRYRVNPDRRRHNAAATRTSKNA